MASSDRELRVLNVLFALRLGVRLVLALLLLVGLPMPPNPLGSGYGILGYESLIVVCTWLLLLVSAIRSEFWLSKQIRESQERHRSGM